MIDLIKESAFAVKFNGMLLDVDNLHAICFGFYEGVPYIGYNEYFYDKSYNPLTIAMPEFHNGIARFQNLFYKKNILEPEFDRGDYDNAGRMWVLDNDIIFSFYQYPSSQEIKSYINLLLAELVEIYKLDVHGKNIRIDTLNDGLLLLDDYINKDKKTEIDSENLAQQHVISPLLKNKDIQREKLKNYYDTRLKAKKIPPNDIAQYNFLKNKGIGESVDAHIVDEVESSDVNLDSFNPQKTLHPKLWVNGKINSRVRLKLLDIADDFIDTLNIGWVKPKDIVLTGSLSNFNWSKFSDIDLHIIVDFKDVDEKVNLVKEYFDAQKKVWNTTHDNIKIYGFPVEIYVQDVNEKHIASGVYSLENNKWINEPNIDKLESVDENQPRIKEKAAKIMTIIDNLYLDYENNKNDDFKIREISNLVKKLFDKIKGMRKSDLALNGEMSVGNIVFKTLRRFDYIDKLIDLKNKTYDISKSLNEDYSISKSKYIVEPEKVLLVKKFLDSNFKKDTIETFDDGGFPNQTPIVGLIDSNNIVVKNMSDNQLFDYLIDEFQNLYNEDKLNPFIKLVIKDWYNNKINDNGTLSTSYY